MSMRIFRVMGLIGALWALAAVPMRPAAGEDGAAAKVSVDLSKLAPGHPRLLWRMADRDRILENARTDPDLDLLVRAVAARGVDTLDMPVTEWKKSGRFVLRDCRRALAIVVGAAAGYRFGGEDPRVLERARAELLAAAALKDWKAPDWLDNGELGLAFALGYDWLYDRLSGEDRAVLRKAMREKVFDQVRREQWFWKSSSNWNQVCTTGLVACALALADETPDMARDFLEFALSRQNGLETAYAPDGVYTEGPMYWSYGTQFSTAMLDMLNTALGTDFGLAKGRGFMESAYFVLHMTGPSKMYFNYGDCSPRISTIRPLGWFARENKDDGLAKVNFEYLRPFLDRLVAAPSATTKGPESEIGGRLLPLELFWYRKAGAGSFPLDWSGRGAVPVAAFRSSWADDGLYLAGKGGKPTVGHGHMDAGQFVLDAMGQRWVHDLGMENYSLPGIWDKKSGGKRWTYLRLGSHGHSVPAIGGKLQAVTEKPAELIHYDNDADAPLAVFDLTPAYQGQAERVVRGMGMMDGRSRVVIRDVFTKPVGAIRWQIITPAAVTIEESGSVLLRSGGKQLRMRLLGRPDAKFAVETLEANAVAGDVKGFGNAKNVRVVAEIPAAPEVRVDVLFEPLPDGDAAKRLTPPPTLAPLATEKSAP